MYNKTDIYSHIINTMHQAVKPPISQNNSLTGHDVGPLADAIPRAPAVSI